MIDKSTLWNSAAKAGLILGLVSVLYLLLTMLTAKIAGGAIVTAVLSIVNVLLWIVKFFGSIWLMRFFMKRFSLRNSESDNATIFRFGVRTALLSALVYSACYMAYTLFVDPSTFEQAFSTIIESGMMDEASREQLNNMLPQMPTYTFFVNLIYCFLFGTVLSAILSRNIPPRNPFKNR